MAPESQDRIKLDKLPDELEEEKKEEEEKEKDKQMTTDD